MSRLKKIVTLLNKIVKKKNIILFNSFPDYSDNSLALYRYICDHRKDITEKYEIIWGQEKDSKIPDYLNEYNIKYISKKSLKGITTFLQSKYIVSTHGYFSNVRSGNGQLQIALWHGCGYKALPLKELHYNGDRMTVTSDLYKIRYSKMFEMDLENVLALGYPRNDLLFKKGNLKKVIPECSSYGKILIWLPTYRKSGIGYITSDGNEKSFCIANLTDDEIMQLNEVLVEKNYLLVIKLHPMDAIKISDFSKISNIKVINYAALWNSGLDLYEVLYDIDVMISDYSSIVIDYMILNRPVIMALSDMNEYRENRGFIFDNISEYFPGPIVSNMSQLINCLKNLETVSAEWKEQREDLLPKFQKYTDNHNCQRVCDYFWGSE